jgi:hypothetical protein
VDVFLKILDLSMQMRMGGDGDAGRRECGCEGGEHKLFLNGGGFITFIHQNKMTNEKSTLCFAAGVAGVVICAADDNLLWKVD